MQSRSAASLILRHQSDPLFTPAEAAEYVGVTENTLSVCRCVGRYNIPFIKVGRLVKYRKSALDAFLKRRTRGRKKSRPAMIANPTHSPTRASEHLPANCLARPSILAEMQLFAAPSGERRSAFS
ncbi:MAG: helix-turn-helix domain-containing protein [Nitrosospira sp.]